MIKINLLPSEERKKDRRISLPSLSGSMFLWPAIVLAFYGGAVFALSTLQGRKLADLEEKIRTARQESESLKPQLAKIRKLTKEREEVNRRLGIIASLDRDRYLRVMIMNELSEKLPSNCWLTSVKEDREGKYSIEGVTFSNYIIADFMNNLEKSHRFGGVNLKVAQEGKILDYDVIKFSMQSTVAAR